jgi:5'-methylthioadenosine phosphorylase
VIRSKSGLPHEVNYRANIWALKQLGATEIIGLLAVGSLQQEIAPGELSLVSQYFDFIKGNREKTFFGDGIAAHVSTAEPSYSSLATDLLSVANANGIELHTDKTYACVDGLRLGILAESLFLQGLGCDLVGMTNVPEVFFAREAQICYLTIAIATDYDCWLDDPEQHVTVEQVISRYGASLEKAKTLLRAYLQSLQEATAVEGQCGCRSALACAVLTPIEAIPAQNVNCWQYYNADDRACYC